MPVHVRWEDAEQTITRLDFVHTFTMNDVFDAWREELNMMHSVSNPVFSLNVFTETRMLIGGLSVTKIVRFIQQNPPPNLVMTIQVADNSTVRGVLATIAKLMSHEVRIVATIEEAKKIIEQCRAEQVTLVES